MAGRGGRPAQGELRPQDGRGPARPQRLWPNTARGTYVDPRTGRITLREYAAGFLAGSTADATTREAAEIRWRVHILPALGDVPLGRLAARPSLIQSFVAGLGRADVAGSYVRVILGNLSSTLGAARR